MSRILLAITVNFGCSSYIYIYVHPSRGVDESFATILAKNLTFLAVASTNWLVNLKRKLVGFDSYRGFKCRLACPFWETSVAIELREEVVCSPDASIRSVSICVPILSSETGLPFLTPKCLEERWMFMNQTMVYRIGLHILGICDMSHRYVAILEVSEWHSLRMFTRFDSSWRLKLPQATWCNRTDWSIQVPPQQSNLASEKIQRLMADGGDVWPSTIQWTISAPAGLLVAPIQ